MNSLEFLFSFRRLFLVTLLFIALFAWALNKGGAGADGFLIQRFSEIAKGRTISYLDARAQYLLDIGNTIARDEKLIQYVEAGDIDQLQTYIVALKTKYGIGSMGVTDKFGFVLLRTRSSHLRGDNIYISSLFGHRVSKGETFISYVQSTRDPREAALTTARPVLQNSAQIGSLFASDFLDDAFAKRMQQMYYYPGLHVAFYTKEYGLYSTSFSTSSDRQQLARIVSPGSSWVINGDTGKLLAYNGQVYLVKNIQLPTHGQDSEVGVLLFLPTYASIQYGLYIACLFLLMYILWRPVIRRYRFGTKRFYVLEIALAISFTIALLVVTYAFYGHIQKQLRALGQPERTIYNSTVRFLPDAGVFDDDYEQPVKIVIDGGGETINSASAVVSYDPEMVEVLSIDTAGTDCYQYLEKTIDNEAGSATLSCMFEPASYEKASFTMGSLLLHPKKKGTFTLHFSNESQVLANDGFATNVLRTMTDAGYSVVDDSAFLWDGDSPTKKALVVHSLSHSNRERWYAKDRIDLMWSALKNVSFGYMLVEDSSSEVVSRGTTTINSIQLTAPKSGVYTFSVQTKDSFGRVLTGSTKVKVDITPPQDTKVVVSQYSIKIGEILRLIVKGQDNESGLSSNYYVSIDNGILLPVGGMVFIPFDSRGAKDIVVRIFDNAGNYVDKAQIIKVGE